MSKTKKTQEQLLNRILTNIAIAILAYIFLYVIYVRFYLSPAIPLGIAFILISVAGYILSYTKCLKKDPKNYAHMFLAFGLALLFTRLSVITGKILGINKFIQLINSSDLIKMLMNSEKEVTIISWLGAIYLVFMFIYNTVLIQRANKKNR